MLGVARASRTERWPRLFARQDLSGVSSPARRSLRQQRRNDHEIVGEHCRADPQLEALASLCKAALHAATAGQHGDAPLDAGSKALALLKRYTLFERFALIGTDIGIAFDLIRPFLGLGH